MCSGGRILAHLERGLEAPVNDVFFVGYHAKGTLGRDICQYADQENGYIQIHDKKILIRAKVYQLSGYSAHADQAGLIQWVQAMPKKPGKIKLVHGEDQNQARPYFLQNLLHKGIGLNNFFHSSRKCKLINEGCLKLPVFCVSVAIPRFTQTGYDNILLRDIEFK